MTTLVRMRFGSHLYGTSTPKSDFDEKSVVLPDARSLLLGSQMVAALERATGEGTVVPSTRPAAEPFYSDVELFQLAKFLILASEGQTVILDMLFAPSSMYLEPAHALWHEILENRDLLLSRKAAGFVEYCRTHASRYSVKAERLGAAQAAVDLVDRLSAEYGHLAPLQVAGPELDELVVASPFTKLVDIEVRRGHAVRHLEVCGRKAPLTASLKTAREVFATVVKNYGQRTRDAVANDGASWKALSHAVRVAYEALEFLETGTITFPRPEAARLLAIKLGQVPFEAVSEELDALLEKVEVAHAASSLPAEPDYAFIEAMVLRAHRAVVEGAL